MRSFRPTVTVSLLAGIFAMVVRAQEVPAPFFDRDRMITYPGGLRILSKHLDQEFVDALATRIDAARRWSSTSVEDGGLGLPPLTSVDVRFRHEPGQAINHYTGGLPAITVALPLMQELIDGSARIEPVSVVFDLLCEASWSRMTRPIWWMPAAARLALNRHFSRQLLPLLQQEFPEGVWPGAAEYDPDDLGWLPENHPLREDRAAWLRVLEDVVQKTSHERLCSRLRLWSARSYDGASAYQDLLALWQDPENPDSEAAELVVDPLPSVVFETRKEWQGPHIGLIQGMQAEPQSTLDFWYAPKKDMRSSQFLALGEGALAMLIRTPNKTGREQCRLKGVTAHLRRQGDFGEQWFYVLVLDEFGRELFRWSYPVNAVSENPEGSLIVMENTVSPQLPEYCFLALELPVAVEGAKLELGFFPREAPDHSFRCVPGRSMTSLPGPGELAMTVSVVVREAGGRSLFEAIEELTKRDREPRDGKGTRDSGR